MLCVQRLGNAQKVVTRYSDKPALLLDSGFEASIYGFHRAKVTPIQREIRLNMVSENMPDVVCHEYAVG